MAITILEEPNILSTIYNEVILVLDSDKKTEDSFEWLVDIKINGVTSSSIRISPNPNGDGVVDLHRHLESAVTSTLDHTNLQTFSTMIESFIKYSVALSESYVVENNYTFSDNSSNVQFNGSFPHGLSIGDRVTVQEDSTVPGYIGNSTVTSVIGPNQFVTSETFTSVGTGTAKRTDGSPSIFPSGTVMTGDKFAVNTSLKFLERQSFDFSDFQLETSTPGRWLSSLSTVKDNTNISIDDRFWSNVFHDVTDSSKFLEVISDNGTFRITNPFSTTSDTNKFLNIGIGPWNLINTTDSVSVVSGSLPIIDSNTKRYTVKTINSSFVPTSETINFKINNVELRFEKFRLIYLDRFGSYLNLIFDAAHRQTTKFQRTTYRKNFGSYDTSWGYNTYDRGNTHLDSDITESFRINSNWVDETVGSQIIEMIGSSNVFHLNEDGTLLAVDIKTNSVNTKTRLNDKLFNYDLTFEYSFKNSIQRG